MNILAFIAEYTSPFGDGVHEREIISRLCSTDDVTIVTLFRKKSYINCFTHKLFFFPFLRPAIFFNILWGIIIGIILCILSLKCRKTFDVIYIRDISLAIGLNILKPIYRVPTVLKTVMFYSDEYFQGQNGLMYRFLSKIVCIIEQTAMVTSDKILVPSSIFMDNLVKRYPVDPKAISVLSVGVDTKAFSVTETSISPGHTYNIGYVGSLHKGNDVKTLLRSISVLKFKIPNIHLILAIKDADLALSTLIHKYGLESVVSIVSVPHNAVPSLLSTLDVVVIPRRSISCTDLVFPLKLLEAGAAKKPVVISKSKVISSIFRDKENVLLVNPEDAADLSDKLLFLYTHKTYQLKLGENLHSFCSNYDWQIIVKKLRVELHNLI